MTHSRFFILALTILMVSCNSRLEKVEEAGEFGEVVQYERNKKTFAKEGEFTRRTSKGKIIEKANYKNDTLHGQRILFFENGQPEIIETYQNGIFVGSYQDFHENGKVKMEGEYTNGQMEGLWKVYYANGQLKEEVNFHLSEENGPFKEYHENGKIKAEGTYLEGDNEDGLLQLYDETGTLVKKMDCKKGVCHTTWTKDQ